MGSDVTRRLFLSGILGALAATVLIEALFIGTTDGNVSLLGAARDRLKDRVRGDHGLDSLIKKITIDCQDGNEALQAFRSAFDEERRFPCYGTVEGEYVEVRSVSVSHVRRELIGTYRRDGQCHEVALLDIDLMADQATLRLVAAYRRWVSP